MGLAHSLPNGVRRNSRTESCATSNRQSCEDFGAYTDICSSMELRELVESLRVVSVEGGLDREVSGITYDSRRVTPGMLFVAIPGQRTDGHEFISSALDRGATAVICERN